MFGGSQYVTDTYTVEKEKIKKTIKIYLMTSRNGKPSGWGSTGLSQFSF